MIQGGALSHDIIGRYDVEYESTCTKHRIETILYFSNRRQSLANLYRSGSNNKDSGERTRGLSKDAAYQLHWTQHSLTGIL
jgi:hypothetical protein